jgi:DNA polymerase III delta prime subunit
LKNEFICIRFNQLPKQDIYQFIKNIAVNEKLSIRQETIEVIQSIYHSDVRSMINFIQLNQNLQENDWRTNVMNNALLEKLHEMLIEPKRHDSNINLIKFIHQLSIQYNIDKKQVMQSYFNFIIRSHSNLITIELLSFMEEIIHNPDASIETLLNYFYLKLNTFYSRV